MRHHMLTITELGMLLFMIGYMLIFTEIFTG
jgi:membrane-bound ClpP family serine protease